MTGKGFWGLRGSHSGRVGKNRRWRDWQPTVKFSQTPLYANPVNPENPSAPAYTARERALLQDKSPRARRVISIVKAVFSDDAALQQ